jgi:hypothetical protein
MMSAAAASWHLQPRSSLRSLRSRAMDSLIDAIVVFTISLLALGAPRAHAALVDTALPGVVQAGIGGAVTASGVTGSRPGTQVDSLATTPPVVPVDTERSRMRCVGRAHDPEGRVCLFTNIYYDGVSQRWLYFGSQIELDRLEPDPADPFIIGSGG